jgi:class 3 adenylate cyclase
LTTIFYADVVDYGRLTGLDEEGTHSRVLATLDNVSQKISSSGGTVLRYAGDAILATFPSVVQAVETSTGMQSKLADDNASYPEKARVHIRIGINLGDVIEDRGEVFGDGVNLAARLEAAAKPGGICISSMVWEQCQGKINSTFADGGEQQFKNISRPVRTYHWNPTTAQPNRSGQLAIVASAVALRSSAPGIVTTVRDLQQVTHQTDWKLAAASIDTGISHVDSLAK